MPPIVDDNQWFQGKTQANRYRANCQIWVAGVQVTSNLDPFLVSVRVYDGSPMTAEIELDDRDARLPIPPSGGALVVAIGWASESMYSVFNGVIDHVESGFDRKRGGRRMWVHGLGMRAGSAIKGPFTDHLGMGAEPGQQQGTPIPFVAAASQFAANGGATVSAGASMASIIRDYWSQNGESILEWISHAAEEHGAVMRVEGGNNIVIGRPSDFNKGSVTATWGDNLISWKIRPLVPRPAWAGGLQQFFDIAQATWQDVASAGGSGVSGASAIARLPHPAPNSGVAQQQADGAAQSSENTKGIGHIVMNGEPQARFMGTVTLVGARPGIDGTYRIVSAEHLYSRQGYTTNLEVWPLVGGGDQPTFATIPTTTTQSSAPPPADPFGTPPSPATPGLFVG